MKRGILLIVMLLMLVDLAQDGYFGDAAFGPIDATISVSFDNSHDYPTEEVACSHSLPLMDWMGITSPCQSQWVMPVRQVVFKIIMSCNNGCSGGIPD